MGFPIRRFTDQSLFAAPHDLSQRTTSFIASQRQGIHQIPLRHLIALIAKARLYDGSLNSELRSRNVRLSDFCLLISAAEGGSGVEKTSFASNASGDLSGQAPNPRLVASRRTENRDRRTDHLSSVLRHPYSGYRMRFLFTMSDKRRTEIGRRRTDRPLSALSAFLHARALWRSGETDKLHRKDRTKTPSGARAPSVLRHPVSVIRTWWSQTGSNRRPHACKARALPTELWPRPAQPARSQKPEVGSQKTHFRFPISVFRVPALVGLGGLEPPTSRLSSARSNQLSYKPLIGGQRSENGERTVFRLPFPVLCSPLSERKRDEGGAVPQMRLA